MMSGTFVIGRCICRMVSTLLLCFLFFITVSAQTTDTKTGHHNHNPVATKPTPASGEVLKRPGAVTIGDVQVPIPDLKVLDQDGKQRRFYSDLIKDKVVVISFFFTKCSSVCPAMSMALLKLQANLGDLLGKEVFIVTVSKDPETDTPRALKEWGKTIGVKSGWTMVTGNTKVIEKIVRDFTGDPLGRGAHNTVFILGSDRTGEWTDLYEYVTAAELREKVDLLSKTNR
jgi:cytochrome oxidase Cu insertion factor (SCO1/SenC/PrrC family)